jgi:type I restriction enzyme, S subunit
MSAAVRAGHKLTEVGVIPEDWDVVRMNSLGEVKRGAGSQYVTYSSESRGVRFIRINDFFEDNPVFVLAAKEVMRFCIDSRDILFAGTGNSAGASYAPDSQWFGLPHSYNAPRIRININVSKKYVLYSLQSGYLLHQQSALFVGAAQPFLDTKAIKGFRIACPPTLREQNFIAATLSDVDALLAKLDALIAKKRDLKVATMQQLLTGKTRLPGFSGEWSSRPIASFSTFVTKGATPTTYGFNWVSDGVIFLRSECVSADGLDMGQSMFISDSAHKVLIRGEVRPDDILITITGNVGRVVLLDDRINVANINQHIARIRVADPVVSPTFVFHWLSQQTVRHYYSTITTGQAYPQISLKQVRETSIPLGSIDEQTAIATILSEMDAELTTLETRRDKTHALKQGMMQELLTGRIRLVASGD